MSAPTPRERPWITERLAGLLSQLSPEAVPSRAREMATRCVLDVVGAVVAGHATEAARATRGLVRDLFASGPSSLWLCQDRRQPAAAALANSAAASALDVDDGHRASGGHPGASIIPAAFAVAEAEGASGRDLLAAIVVGYDVAVRVAAAREPTTIDTFATGRWCAYGAAAAAGWLRRLPAARLAEALAIAGAEAPGLHVIGYSTHKGSHVKEGLPWSTLTGLAAVDLAARGYTGPADLLDYPTHFDARRLLDGWGREWAIETAYFKPYACCRWIHAAIDGLLGLQREHALQPEEITSVQVHTFGRGLRFNHPNPDTLEAAQFSIPFCLAVAAHEGRDAFLPLSPALLGRPDLVAFAAKVELRVDPELDALFPGRSPARLVLRTARGEFERRVDHPLGDPEKPLTTADLRAKFCRLTARCWSPDVKEQAIAAVLALEEDGFPRLAKILEQPFD